MFGALPAIVVLAAVPAWQAPDRQSAAPPQCWSE
jgi:hypothetical protein